MAKPHSKRSRSRCGNQKQQLQRAARRTLGLNTGALHDLFDVVAKSLGKSWNSKEQGYQLLAELEGCKLLSSPSKPHSDVSSDDFLSSYEWRRLRMVVIKKRSPRCECCGATPADGHTVINVDHIKPRRLHPELALEESNLQILCSPCNHGKGNWDETDWRDWQPPEMYEPIWNSTPATPVKQQPARRPDMLPRLVKRKVS